MTAVDASARLPAVGGLDLRRVLAIAGRAPGLVVAIACAWLIVVGAAVTGTNDLLHHHSLIEGGPPLVVALPLFLVGWLVMVTAMMLPVSLPAVVGRSGEEAALIGGPRARAGFLGGYALIWAGFGVATFAGDVVVHRVVDTTPWLAAHAWIIDAGLLVLAGAYQFAPAKRRSLALCRHPGDDGLSMSMAPADRWLGRGVRHGLACVASSWALMLVMFASGFAALIPMIALTVVMLWETWGRDASRAATVAGAMLLIAALTVLPSPSG